MSFNVAETETLLVLAKDEAAARKWAEAEGVRLAQCWLAPPLHALPGLLTDYVVVLDSHSERDDAEAALELVAATEGSSKPRRAEG